MAWRCWRASVLLLCFLLLFWHLISEVTERISTKLGHIFTSDCYLKNFVRTPLGIYPHGLGAKTAFLGPNLNFDRTYLCNGTWYQQSKRNLSIYRDSPTCPQIWWTLVQKRLRTGWRIFANPLIFCIGRRLTAWTLYSVQQANFGTCYVVARAYSLEQQNAGRAHAGLCHASSLRIEWLA